MKLGKKVIVLIAIVVVFILVLMAVNGRRADRTSTAVTQIETFFKAFYQAAPETLDEIPLSIGENGEIQALAEALDQYAADRYGDVYTEDFYKNFLMGDRYLIYVPEVAKANLVTVSCDSIELEPEASDGYYKFAALKFYDDGLVKMLP